MNKYESVIIIKPNLSEEEKNNEINKYKEMYEKFSNEDVNVENLGKKRLAYEVRGNKEGDYTIFNFYANSEDIAEVERSMRIDDNVIKFITVKSELELEENDESMEDEDMEI